MTIFTHLCGYLHKRFTLSVITISTHHRLQEDIGLNAVEVTELIVYLELRYMVDLPDESLSHSLIAGQLGTLITRRMGEKHNLLSSSLFGHTYPFSVVCGQIKSKEQYVG